MSSPLRLLLLKNKTQPLDAYHETFTDKGHGAEFIPLLEHSALDIAETVRYLESEEFIKNTKRFIITSQRAVEVFHECLRIISQNNPDNAENIRGKVGYTVGPATAEVLAENGFIDVRGGAKAGNGLKLADLIMEELANEANSNTSNSDSNCACSDCIVFFTGVIRKDIIPVKLKGNGVPIKEVVIYKTEAKEGIIDNFLDSCNEHVDWIVFFSPQGTEEIVDHIVKTSPKVYFASIGPTTEEYLLLKGITPHVVAAKPTAASLYEGIEAWMRR